MEMFEKNRSLRRSTRSAMNPVTGTSSTSGSICRPIVMPTAAASWSVSSVSTIQSCAVRCIQNPTLDTRAPANHIR
jgi:hypothetical protein